MRISDWSSDVCSSDLPQLFDLEADPDEYVDLGESPAHEDARAAMAARLLAWLKQRRIRTTISNEDVEKRTGNAKSRGILFRSEEHTSELQSLMRISYAVFCLQKKTKEVQTKIQR